MARRISRISTRVAIKITRITEMKKHWNSNKNRNTNRHKNSKNSKNKNSKNMYIRIRIAIRIARSGSSRVAREKMGWVAR